jgi:hypothetical protein
MAEEISFAYPATLTVYPNGLFSSRMVEPGHLMTTHDSLLALLPTLRFETNSNSAFNASRVTGAVTAGNGQPQPSGYCCNHVREFRVLSALKARHRTCSTTEWIDSSRLKKPNFP